MFMVKCSKMLFNMLPTFPSIAPEDKDMFFKRNPPHRDISQHKNLSDMVMLYETQLRITKKKNIQMCASLIH